MGSSDAPDRAVILTLSHDVDGLVQAVSHKSPVSVAALCSGNCSVSR